MKGWDWTTWFQRFTAAFAAGSLIAMVIKALQLAGFK